MTVDLDPIASITNKPKIKVVSVEDLLAMRAKEALTGDPQYVAIRQKTAFDKTAGDAFEVLVYPEPTGADTAYFHYAPKAAKLTDTNNVPYGSADHAETLLACCLLVADPNEANQANYVARMRASVKRDQDSAMAAKGTPYPVSSSALTPYQELARDAGIVLGFGPYPNVWDHSQLGIVDMVVSDGLRQFYVPPPLGRDRSAHSWSFMRPVATLALVAGDIDYTLPTAYSAMDGPFTFVAGGTEVYPPVEIVNDAKIRELHQYTNQTGPPQYAAVRPIVSDGSADQTYEVVFFPTPEQSYTMAYRYQAKMAALTTTAPYPLGDWAVHSRAISASVKDCASSRRGDMDGRPVDKRYRDEYFAQLRASVDYDRRAHSPENYGYNSDNSVLPGRQARNLHQQFYNVTYEGVLYEG